MTAPAALPTIADVRRIAEMLPHRYPFLLIDRVIAFEPGKSLTALKNVTINEPFFQGHFPNHPVMPGVLILEALAQASGVLVQMSGSFRQDQESLYYLVKIDKARFTRIVVPGDQLRLEVSQRRMLHGMGQFIGEARVDGQIVASAEIMCAARGTGQ